MSHQDFIDWLRVELDRRGWKPADLARRGGIDPGHLSRVMNGTRKVGSETCIGIATAFRIRPEEVFRRANLSYDAKPADDDTNIRDIIDMLLNMSKESQENAARYIRFLDYEDHGPKGDRTDGQGTKQIET